MYSAMKVSGRYLRAWRPLASIIPVLVAALFLSLLSLSELLRFTQRLPRAVMEVSSHFAQPYNASTMPATGPSPRSTSQDLIERF